jgi:hypothetical protein
MFSICSHKVKPHMPTGNLFFVDGPRGKIFAASRRVDVGEKDLPKAAGFGEPDWPSEARATIRR